MNCPSLLQRRRAIAAAPPCPSLRLCWRADPSARASCGGRPRYKILYPVAARPPHSLATRTVFLGRFTPRGFARGRRHQLRAVSPLPLAMVFTRGWGAGPPRLLVEEERRGGKSRPPTASGRQRTRGSEAGDLVARVPSGRSRSPAAAARVGIVPLRWPGSGAVITRRCGACLGRPKRHGLRSRSPRTHARVGSLRRPAAPVRRPARRRFLLRGSRAARVAVAQHSSPQPRHT